MTVNELIAYRDELFCSDAIRSYEKKYMIGGIKQSEDFELQEGYPLPSYRYMGVLGKIQCICQVIIYKRSCMNLWFYFFKTNRIDENGIVKIIKEKIKFNPYVSYIELLQLDPSLDIEIVLEYLIDTKKLINITLDKKTKYGNHKWQWR